MIERALFRLLDAAARHRAATGLLTGVVAAVAIVGGVVLGASRPVTAAPGDEARSPAAVERFSTVAAGRTALQGVVIAVRPQGFALRTPNGRTVLVRVDAQTQIRRGGRNVGRAALRRAQRVVVLGRVQPNGVLRALGVAIRGQVNLPRPAPTPLD